MSRARPSRRWPRLTIDNHSQSEMSPSGFHARCSLDIPLMPPIYLDYNATTPVDPAVAEFICEQLKLNFGNPSSTHIYGQAALAAINEARAQVAKANSSTADELLFQSGSTEAS